jgi:hypothetical protein
MSRGYMNCYRRVNMVSGSEINVKILLGGEQSVNSDEAENVIDNSSTQPDVWANSDAERPHFPFTGNPSINVDIEDPSNLLEYFELFCMPDIEEVIARETNRYSQKFVENTPILKLKCRIHCWASIENYIIIKYSQ